MASTTMTTEARSSGCRGLLELLQRRETFWGALSAEDRENCINRKTRRTFGGIEAFDIAGALRTRWNEEIYPKLRQLLQSRKAWIFKQVGTEVLYAFHLYVILNGEEVVPSFVAICYKIDVAHRIIKLVKSSKYLEDIGLRYYSFNSYLNSTAGTDHDDLHVNSTNVCGESICILRGGNPPRRCTLGGCIKLDDRIFGLTIAHVLFDEVPPSEQSDSFTDDVQSQMQLTLDSDDDSSLSDCAISEVREHPSFSEDQNFEVTPDLSRCFWSMEYPELAKLHANRLLAAKREQLPIHQVDVQRDWLLTTFEVLLSFHGEPEKSFPSYHNELKKPSGEVVMIHGIQYEPVDTKVSLCLGSSTTSRPAYMSTTLTGLYIPTTKAVVDTWSCISTAIAGDSGSWAVDDNGCVYGTIVATNEASKTSYVIPMQDTIASIKARNPGLAISFPVGPELDRRNAKLEDVGHSKHSSSAYQEDMPADTSITASQSTTMEIVYEASPRLAKEAAPGQTPPFSATAIQIQTSGHPKAFYPMPGRLRLPPTLPLPTASADSRSLPTSSLSSPLVPGRGSMPQHLSPYTLSGSRPAIYGYFPPQEGLRPSQATPISLAETNLPPRNIQSESLVPQKRRYDKFPESLLGPPTPLSVLTPASIPPQNPSLPILLPPLSAHSSISNASTPIDTTGSPPLLVHNLTSYPPPLEVSSNTITSRCSLHIRQQPSAARAGPDGKDRRNVDPPPVLQLLLTDFSPDSATDISELKSHHYVVHCKLISAESPRRDVTTYTAVLEDGLRETSRLLLGTNVASPFFCADDPDVETMPQHPRSALVEQDLPSLSNSFVGQPSSPPIDPLTTLPGSFFIFADLSIQRAGSYRLEFTLMKIDPSSIHLRLISVVTSNVFKVVDAKDFDHVHPSTRLVRGLLERGAPFPLKLKKVIREGQRGRGTAVEGDGGSIEGSTAGRGTHPQR